MVDCKVCRYGKYEPQISSFECSLEATNFTQCPNLLEYEQENDFRNDFEEGDQD